MALTRDARLLFIGMWNFADDHGRFKWAPGTLKAQIFPGDLDLDAQKVEAMMVSIADRGLIRRYGHPIKVYCHITGWHHQKVQHPAKSKLPSPQDFPDAIERLSRILVNPHEESGGLTSPHESSRLIHSSPLEKRTERALCADGSVAESLWEDMGCHGEAAPAIGDLVAQDEQPVREGAGCEAPEHVRPSPSLLRERDARDPRDIRAFDVICGSREF